MSDETGGGKPTGVGEPTLKFDYIKSNYFRVVHMDGAWGGLTPNLNVRMVLYNERPAIPQEVVHPINPDGTIGSEKVGDRQVRDAIVREVEVDVVMDLPTAEALYRWLAETLSNAQRILNQQEGETKKK